MGGQIHKMSVQISVLPNLYHLPEMWHGPWGCRVCSPLWFNKLKSPWYGKFPLEWQPKRRNGEYIFQFQMHPLSTKALRTIGVKGIHSMVSIDECMVCRDNTTNVCYTPASYTLVVDTKPFIGGYWWPEWTTILQMVSGKGNSCLLDSRSIANHGG